MVFKKTLVHVYTNQYPFGFGEFVRGTLFLLSYVNKNDMILQLNLVNHAMSEYVTVSHFDLQGLQTKVYFEGKDLNLLTDDLNNFKDNSAPVFAVSTNIGIHKNEIDPLSIIQFNNLVSFTSYIQDKVRDRLTGDLFNISFVPSITDQYNVINMYLADTKLDRSQIQSLSSQIRSSLDLSKTSIVISSSEYIRRTVTEFLGGYHVPLSSPSKLLAAMEDSIIDFLIVSKSKKIYTFTEYNTKLKKATYNVRDSTSLSKVKLSSLYYNYITSTFAGIFPEAEFTDGTTTTAAFAYPCGITRDSTGTVYVADTMNNNIRKINTDGTVTTVAGSQNQTIGTIDAQGVNALFSGPTGITINGSTGILYVVDAISGLIRTITPDGIVQTLAGSTAGFEDGAGSNAKFNFLYN